MKKMEVNKVLMKIKQVLGVLNSFKGNKIIQVFRSMIYKINNIQIMIWKPRSNQKVKVNKAKIVI